MHPVANDPRPLSHAGIKNRATWLAITYVCRYWRNVALHSARLWSCIILNEDGSPNMLREFLKRSRHAVLSVIIEGPSSQSDSIEALRYMAAMCAVCTHRLGSLYISRFSPLETNTILSPFRHAGVQLRALVVSAEYHPMTPVGTHLVPIFSGELPALSSIIVSQLSLPWRPFTNLTQMLLMNQPVPSLSELTATLRKCPALDSLGLGLIHPSFLPDPPGVPADESPIELPLLTNMLLIAHHDVAAPLIRLLHYPSSATTVLALQHSPRSRVTASNNVVAHVRRAALDMYVYGRCHCLKITSASDCMVQVQWDWREGVDPFDDDMRLEHIGDLVRFSGLEQLTIKHLQYALYEQDWLHILGQMPSLRRIELSSCFIGDATLFDALSRCTTDISGEATFEVCPNLATFVVSGGHEYSEVVLEQLVSCFEHRRDHDAHLSVLKVELRRTPDEYPPELLERLQEGDLADTIEIFWPFKADADRASDDEDPHDSADDLATRMHVHV